MGVYGKLYLLPVPISDGPSNYFLPEHNFKIIKQLRYFIAEDAKTARKFLKWFAYPSLETAEIQLLNQHTQNNELQELLTQLLAGNDMGLMSDAGCPGIADPGADLISFAHEKGVEVVPLVGPSSIVLSIMASGFNGQNFAFVGYLPISKQEKIKRIKELESLATKQKQAQFFIETPYRNQQLYQDLLESLRPQTRLFIGKDITSAEQRLVSKYVAEWKKMPPPQLQKIPVVFGLF